MYRYRYRYMYRIQAAVLVAAVLVATRWHVIHNHRTVPYCTVLYYEFVQYTVLYSRIPLYLQYDTVQYGTKSSTVSYCTV